MDLLNIQILPAAIDNLVQIEKIEYIFLESEPTTFLMVKNLVSYSLKSSKDCALRTRFVCIYVCMNVCMLVMAGKAAFIGVDTCMGDR